MLRENITPTHGTPPHTRPVAKLAGISPTTSAPAPALDHPTSTPWSSLIRIDEAAMAATADLAHVVSFALARGGERAPGR